MFKVQKFNVAQQDEEKDRPFSVILCPAGNFVPQVDARRSSRNFGSFGLLRTGFGFWTSDSMNQVSLLGSLVSLYGQSRALRRYVIPIQSPSSQML